MWRSAGYFRNFATSAVANKSRENALVKYIVQKIKSTGPLTVAEYMKEALTNPISGYYMHKDVFGKHGDFTTSPEISQMFGEMLGIWCVSEWLQSGQPKRVRIIEFGPGRGTLMDDLLRVFAKFDAFRSSLRVSLIEVSPTLGQMQAVKLCSPDSVSSLGPKRSVDSPGYRECSSLRGSVPVEWFTDLDAVPKDDGCFGIYLAHEFFDALPIHRFQMAGQAWREVLIDVAGESDPHHLRYVLAHGPTAASKIFTSGMTGTKRAFEINPLAGIIVQKIAMRIAGQGGSALIADYGHSGEKEDTFRAFKSHKLHDPLEEPGTADLTADVDFSFLQRCAGSAVSVCGPITQQAFLHNMGIGVRLKVLLDSAAAAGKEEVQKSLISGYDMMTNPQKMGERFKFFAMFSKNRAGSLPAGFTALT